MVYFSHARWTGGAHALYPSLVCNPALDNTARLPVGASYREAAMFQWIPSEVIALANCQRAEQKSLI